MTNILVNRPMPDFGRREAIFEGSLLLYARNAATEALVGHAANMIQDAFG